MEERREKRKGKCGGRQFRFGAAGESRLGGEGLNLDNGGFVNYVRATQYTHYETWPRTLDT